jgi:endogenous inhibitor of DNA gyrase (YacG/DUF329 family)
MTCPTCDGPVDEARARAAKSFPFCCERCQLVDLGRWLGEEFRVSEPIDPMIVLPERE